MTPKINVKERLTDGEIDLSMSDLEEVPVKDIALLKKAYSLDLSNNRLAILPKTFPTLTHITKLDLSKNELKELPEDFGNLCKLKHLDLYQNKLQHLPLSFSKLKDLKWLDLKDNPLVPTVAKVAGPCLDTKQCQSCAKDVVNFFLKLEQQVNSELESRNKSRKKQLEINQQKKQEEKKMKKKEKQKQRQDSITAQKNHHTKEKIKKEINKKPNAKPLKQEVHSSFLKSFFTVLIITGALLFILTSMKLDFTKNVEQLSIVLYHRGLEQLPPNLQVYGRQGGNFICKFHEKTGNVSLSAINFIYDKVISKEKCTELFENAATFFQHIITKLKDLYKNLVST